MSVLCAMEVLSVYFALNSWLVGLLRLIYILLVNNRYTLRVYHNLLEKRYTSIFHKATFGNLVARARHLWRFGRVSISMVNKISNPNLIPTQLYNRILIDTFLFAKHCCTRIGHTKRNIFYHSSPQCVRFTKVYLFRITMFIHCQKYSYILR